MPTICFGQQPNGFFPKNFFVAKILTAQKLQKDLGGKIAFFYHDSDADYRETVTVLKDKATGSEVRLNFFQENKIQKNFSPLYAKRIVPSPTAEGKGVEGWKEEILKQLPRFIHPPLTPPLKGGETTASPSALSEGQGLDLIDIFKSVDANTVADFCLEIYKKMGLLEGVEIYRSSDKNFRLNALDLSQEYFADILYQNEAVRAKKTSNGFQLHKGGGQFIDLPEEPVEKTQKTPAAKERFAWMNSVINCTHYIYGEGEAQYMDFKEHPKVQFIQRDIIDNPTLAWLSTLNS